MKNGKEIRLERNVWDGVTGCLRFDTAQMGGVAVPGDAVFGGDDCHRLLGRFGGTSFAKAHPMALRFAAFGDDPFFFVALFCVRFFGVPIGTKAF